MRYKTYSLLVSSALLVVSTMSSCSRLGVNEKAILICATGGTAGTVLAQQSRVGLVASFASALLPATQAIIVSRTPATPEQIERASQVGREYLSKVSPTKLASLQRQQVSHVAVKTTTSKNTRGTSVMIYDIETKELETTEVFDVRIEPEEGSKLKFDSYVTEYVGDGDVTAAATPVLPALPLPDLGI